MNKRDQNKTSLVEFLRSIKFTQTDLPSADHERHAHFAHFRQSVPAKSELSQEDSQLVRSAN